MNRVIYFDQTQSQIDCQDVPHSTHFSIVAASDEQERQGNPEIIIIIIIIIIKTIYNAHIVNG